VSSLPSNSNEDGQHYSTPKTDEKESRSKSFAMKMEDGIHVDARDDHTEYFNRSIREEVRVSVDTTHRDKQELPKLPKLKVLAAFDARSSRRSPSPSAD